MELGNWSLIDIETTGIDPQYDEIIDIGFLRFEGTKLVKTYSSLVRSDVPLSQFIQKLTGIKPEQVRKAPSWDEVKYEIALLENDNLLAHNSDFEKMFLEEELRNDDGEVLCSFHDSLLFLGLLFPEKSALNLEHFILEFGIAEKEMHRGYEDSVDLLKVILSSVYLRSMSDEFKQRLDFVKGLVDKYQYDQLWYFKLLFCDDSELIEIADQIEFDMAAACRFFLESKVGNGDDIALADESKNLNFPLEFDSKSIQKILSSEAEIQKVIPYYKYRKSQEDLALRCGQSFKNNVHSMIQAPTGTGKTLGYLLPASLYSLSEDKQVLVATGTKTLQNQAIEKDLPQLRKIIGLNKDKLKVQRLIGSSNHYCEMLFRRDASEGLLLDLNTFEEKFIQGYFEFVFYLNDVLGKDLNRGDLAFILKKKVRGLKEKDQEIAVDFKACTGKRCPFKHGCTYLQGLMKAKEANIIIGNHALMFSWPKGFPRPSHVIVDEAHKIEEEANNAFAFELTQGALESFIKSMGNLQGMGALFYLISTKTSGEDAEKTELISKLRMMVKDHAGVLSDHVKNLANTCELYFKKRPRYSAIYWNEGEMPQPKKSKDELSQAIINYVSSIKFIFEDLYQKLVPYAQMFEPSDMKEDNDLSAFTKFEAFFSQIEETYLGLSHFVPDKEKESDSNQVTSLKFHEEYGFGLYSAPIDIGQIVHDQLLQTSESVVFTSATLGNSQGTMGTRGIEWPLGYLYLDPEKRFKTGFYLPPVYDYQKQSKIFLCDDAPNLYGKDFVPAVMEKIIPLIKSIGGRSLLLFSARVRFEIAREVLLDKLGEEIPLFIQGMGNRVVEDYKKSPNGVLLGMEAFGEGIDIPGESLQFVFIDKIPDMRQDLINKSRRDFYDRNFGNEFLDYFMAARARKLHQKLGRLLRRETDSGGAIVVDSRIKNWKPRTMDQFNSLMEPYYLTRTNLDNACEEIQNFIRE